MLKRRVMPSCPSLIWAMSTKSNGADLRSVLVLQLARVADALPSPLPIRGDGRYHVEVVVTVADGDAAHVKTSSFFERFENLNKRRLNA